MWYGNIATEASRGHICETRVVNLNHSTSPPSIDLPWPLEWWDFDSHWGWNLFSEFSSLKGQFICREKKTLISQKSCEFGVKNAYMRPVKMSLNVFKYQKNKISTLKRRQHAKTHHGAVIFYYLDSVHCILLCICIPWQVFIKHSICCVRPALSCTCETFLHTLNNSHLFLYLVLSLYFVFFFM